MLTVKNCVRFAVAGFLAASMFVVTGGEAVGPPKVLKGSQRRPILILSKNTAPTAS